MHQTSFEIIAVAPHLVRGMFYGLSVADPLTLLCTVLLLVVVAVAAGLLPAHRASRVDPIVALRYE